MQSPRINTYALLFVFAHYLGIKEPIDLGDNLLLTYLVTI